MSRRGGIIKNFTVAVLTISALGAAMVLLLDRRQGALCKRVTISVPDSATLRFVSPDMVGLWLDSAHIKLTGQKMNDLDLYLVRHTILSQPYVRSVQVNSSIEGIVSITVDQYKPAIRILSENGYDFYADSLGNIIPTTHGFSADVPLVTGYVHFSFSTDFFGALDQKKEAKDMDYIKKLINFVEFIERDAFLSRLVGQVYLFPDRSVELTTTFPGQKVIFGRIDNSDISLSATGETTEERLYKLRDFFAQAPREVAAGTRCSIVVKYRGQVVVKYAPYGIVGTKTEDN